MIRRVILSGGGTGGHIYPAITIARQMAEMRPTDFLFVGSEDGLEKDIIPKEGYPFTTLKLRGFERRLTAKHFVTAYLAGKSLGKAAFILKKFQPDVVVGTGGYVCGPILLAASMLRIPTLIQEQNVVPGITNRVLAKFVTRIALGYEEAGVFFNKPKKCVLTGNPVRKAIAAATREESRAKLNIPADHFVLLAAGGSRGAQSINRAMIPLLHHYAQVRGVTILHVTGEGDYQAVVQDIKSKISLDDSPHLRIISYMDEMPDALAAADLAVYRAGAIGLAELTVRGLPAILIPYPYATADHQRYNANVMAAAGAAKIIDNAKLSGHLLLKTVEELRRNPESLKKMGQESKHLGNPAAAEKIAELAFSLIR